MSSKIHYFLYFKIFFKHPGYNEKINIIRFEYVDCYIIVIKEIIQNAFQQFYSDNLTSSYVIYSAHDSSDSQECEALVTAPLRSHSCIKMIDNNAWLQLLFTYGSWEILCREMVYVPEYCDNTFF